MLLSSYSSSCGYFSFHDFLVLDIIGLLFIQFLSNKGYYYVMMRNLSTLIGVTQPYLWLDLYTYALPFYMLRFQTPSPYLCQYHASFQLFFGLCGIFFEETQCHFTEMWFIFLNFLPILLLPFEEMLVLV